MGKCQVRSLQISEGFARQGYVFSILLEVNSVERGGRQGTTEQGWIGLHGTGLESWTGQTARPLVVLERFPSALPAEVLGLGLESGRGVVMTLRRHLTFCSLSLRHTCSGTRPKL